MRFLMMLMLISTAHAQVAVGTRSLALNSQQAMVAESAGTVFLNPSLLLEQSQFSAWASYFQPFNLAELRVVATAAHYNQRRIAAGLGLQQFGNTLYTEQTIIFAFAVAPLTSLHAGISGRWQQISIARHGTASRPALDAGLRLRVDENVAIGVLARNVVAGRFGHSAERPARELLTAARIRLNGMATLFAEIAQQPYFDTEFRFAVELAPVPMLALRIGTGLNTPQAFAAGFGLQVTSLHLHYALQNHPALPQTHIFSIAIERGK